MTLVQQAATFPHKPGVYLFKDTHGHVLYVGKAKDLAARIRSYVVPGRDERYQIAFLIRRTASLDYIITDNEKEALLLENTLIKQHRPRYNLHLRDDKTYISVRIGLEHPSPGISLTRRALQDGAAYFGPYASGLAAREAVEQVVRFFRIRTCTDREFSNRVRPCLQYDIGRCTAPCTAKVGPLEYAEQVEQALMFFSGRSAELSTLLKEQMNAAAESMRYEDAARARDALRMLDEVREQQKAVVYGGGDYDAVGLARNGEHAAICVLMVRSGVLRDRKIYPLGTVGGEDAALITSFLLQRYRSVADLPEKIAIPIELEDRNTIEDILSESRAARVELAFSRRGVVRRMVQLAEQNAQDACMHVAQRSERHEEALERLAQKLMLPTVPRSIECVDISNLSGREAYGATVHFVDGEPDKRHYRLYRIRELETPDDYAMMREVLSRRFAAQIKRGKNEPPPQPDMLLVDGGRGQLNIALRALADVGVTNMHIAAIAKGAGRKSDHVFIPGRSNPVLLRDGSAEMLLLMRIRDEAHRFGLNAHRRRREKESLKKS